MSFRLLRLREWSFEAVCFLLHRLENNNFKDDVMELLGSLLSAKDCHIRKIRLDRDIS